MFFIAIGCSINFLFWMVCSAWIIRVIGHEQMVREKKQFLSSDEEDDQPEAIAVSQKRKPVQKVKPTVDSGENKKKKKKNDGLLQESQFFEVETDSE